MKHKMFRNIVLFNILLQIFCIGCRSQKNKPDEHMEVIEKKDERGRLILRIYRGKESGKVAQRSTWKYDGDRLILQEDMFPIQKDHYKNEYGYNEKGLASIYHYKNGDLIAEEKFAGSKDLLLLRVQYEQGRVAIREETRYNADYTQWIYKETENTIDGFTEKKKRAGSRILQKTYKKGVLSEEIVFNDRMQKIRVMPLIHGYHTIIAEHSYEPNGKFTIHETKVRWHSNPQKVIDIVYPLKKELFGVDGDYIDPKRPDLGVSVEYWKKAGKKDIKKLRKKITQKGMELW